MAAASGLLLRRANDAPVVDGAWDEALLDIRTRDKRRRLARIVGGWLHRCAADGYEAAELDNLDSFTRSHGVLRAPCARKAAENATEDDVAELRAIGEAKRPEAAQPPERCRSR